MKIDFAMLNAMVENGSPAAAIVAVLKLEYERGEAKRKRDKENKIISRAGLPKATRGDTRRQNVPLGADNGRQPATQNDKERQLFARAKVVLGQNSGGMVTTLLKSNGFDVDKATALIETSMSKADPREFVAAAIRRNGNGQRNSVMDACDDLIERAGRDFQASAEPKDITPGSPKKG